MNNYNKKHLETTSEINTKEHLQQIIDRSLDRCSRSEKKFTSLFKIDQFQGTRNAPNVEGLVSQKILQDVLELLRRVRLRSRFKNMRSIGITVLFILIGK
jgi:hypothetical protein